ncbi:hypothetical protein ACXDF8_03855 [Mycolicibacterium sp. CBM1]
MSAPETIIATRRQLHAIAENLIAGPQYRAAATVRLAVRPDGFTGTAVPISVSGVRLLWGEESIPLAGPVSELVQATGLDIGPPPAEVYPSTAPLDLDAVLQLDPGAADAVYRSLYAGGFAIKAVLAEGHPVLWPEHFDVSTAVGEVNYGVSAGDDTHPLPYAYVGPWNFAASPPAGALWNAPFGALHPLDTSADADALAADITEFFGRARAAL